MIKTKTLRLCQIDSLLWILLLCIIKVYITDPLLDLEMETDGDSRFSKPNDPRVNLF